MSGVWYASFSFSMALGGQKGLLMKVKTGEEGRRCEFYFCKGWKGQWTAGGEEGSSPQTLGGQTGSLMKA